MNNEEFQKIVLEKFDSMDKRFDSVDKRFDAVDKRLDTSDKRFESMEKRFDIVDSQLSENTQILKALVHSVEVVKAEQEKMTIDVAYIKGDVTAIKNDLFTVETMTVKNYADIVQLKTVKQ